MKKFLYLIQGRKNNILTYINLKSDDSDVVTLTFDEEILPIEYDSLANIFFPKSTWAEGRNKQLEFAMSLPHEYLYYIFIDDDVKFIRGSFREFEELILKYKPAVAVPLLTIVKDTFRYNPRLEIQRPLALDTQITAFHIDTIKEGILMPLVTQFDSKSWFYSCEIINFLILSKYSGRAIQFNKILVDNIGHCWDSKNERPKDTISLYVGGVTEEGLKETRELIVNKFGEQPALANTLFHDKNYKKYIYLPRGLNFTRFLIKNLINFRLKTVAFSLISLIENQLRYKYPLHLRIKEKI